MIEGARVQVEKIRPRHERLLRYVGLEVVLPRGWMVTAGTVLMPLVRPLMPRRVRALMPRVRLSELARRLPEVTEPVGTSRGTVAILAGCVQDRWFRQVNRATIAVLARNGWRVLVPRHECCGALSAHYGHLEAARRMARRDLPAFASADWVIVNGAGCSAHMKEWGHLLHGEARAAEVSAKVRDFMEFLDEQGFEPPVGSPFERVALHDPCHLLHAQRIAGAPRRVLRQVPGLELAEVPDGDRCCGAAGLYNVLEPEMADELQRAKAANIAGTGAAAVLVANPGCAMQISAGLGEHDADIAVLHPAELLDGAYRASARGASPGPTRNRARSR
jgi:glycolate oxidase iron-sulfur subunit